jgi:hypothetical protein
MLTPERGVGLLQLESCSAVLVIRSVDPRFVGGNSGSHGPLYLDGDLLRRYLKHVHNRTEQEVYAWMTTSEMGFPVTQGRGEVQCWRDIVEDRPVDRFLEPVITDYIREVQDKETSGEGPHRLLLELEELDREWSQNEWQSGNYRGRNRYLTGMSFTPHAVDLNASEHTEVKKLRQRNWNRRLSQGGRTFRIHSRIRM